MVVAIAVGLSAVAGIPMSPSPTIPVAEATKMVPRAVKLPGPARAAELVLQVELLAMQQLLVLRAMQLLTPV